MAIRLEVPSNLAREAIQKEVADLGKRKSLIFTGKTKKEMFFSEYVLKETSAINIQLQKENIPLNEPFEFIGWTKLTYETVAPEETGFQSYTDGADYIVRGKATLTDKEGYIAVSIERNEIEITDNIC